MYIMSSLTRNSLSGSCSLYGEPLPQLFLYYLAPPMADKHHKIKFPLWQYLNQPLFNRDLELNPRRFAYSWRVGMLKRCWSKECDAKGPQQH